MRGGSPRILKSLGPYDRFFLASGLSLMERGYPGHHVFLSLMLRGRLDVERLNDSLARAIQRHPILTARVECTRWLSQPRWVAETTNQSASPGAATPVLEFVSLTDHPDPDARRNALLHAAAQEKSDPFGASSFRIWVFQFDAERAEFVVCWPHHLMDLSAVERLLAELDGRIEAAAGLAGGQKRNGFARSFVSFCRGMWRLRRVNFLKGNRLKAHSNADSSTFETMRREWSIETTAAIDSAAKANCASGPMLHTRWHITSLVRALDVVFARHGTHRREHYLISLPQRREVDDSDGSLGGNNLTIRTLVLQRDSLGDPSAADAALFSQFDEYARERLDEADEMVTAFPGYFPLPLYVWLLRRFRIFPRYSVGFTSYRAADMPDGLFGCDVETVSTWGVPTSPPGIIAALCRFRGRLGCSLNWFSNICTPALAAEILDEYERQLTATR